MISSDALAYCTRGIIRHLNGDKEEFKKLVNKAIDINEKEPELTKCKYKIDGEWIRGKINFRTGTIYDLSGQVIRRCHIWQ